MRRFLLAYFALLVLPAPLTSLAQTPSWTDSPALEENANDWKLVKSQDHLSLFTADYGTSDFEAFKAQAVIDQPLEAVFAVIADPVTCPRWVDGCLKSESLQIESFNNRVGYALNDLPWPFKNREVIVRIHTRSASDANTLYIDMFTEASLNSLSLDDTSLEDTSAFRIESSHARYILRRASDEVTELVWMQHTEPGGALPAWLVNSMVIDLPRKSIAKLADVAADARYQNARLQRDNSGHVIGLTLSNGEAINTTPDRVGVK